MPEFTVTTGIDTDVTTARPTMNFSGRRYPRIETNLKRTFLSMPLAVSGETVLSAILSVPVRNAFAAQTLTLRAFSAAWKADRVTWNNQPGLVGPTADCVTGAKTDGQRIEFDVTALVQAIANGQPNYGWRITTTAGSLQMLYGFDSGEDSWSLAVETSDAPQAPTQLTPDGIISLDKWVCAVDEVDDMAAINVRVDANQAAAYDFDSGEVATTEPLLDLAATAYAGLADAATTFWQARVKTTDGAWSEWSDWAQVTRRVKPVLTLDSPSGTDIWDPTPDITAHLTPAGTAATRWRVLVTAATDPTDVRYDSGQLSGATVDHGIPLRYKGRVVFPADGDYRLVVRAWDRTDRVASQGDPTYVQEVRTVTTDSDALVTPPDTLTATQTAPGAPTVLLHWTRAADPDRFVVYRDGQAVETVDVDEARVAPGVWEWTDRTAAPNVAHTWTVRAVTAGISSPGSPADAMSNLTVKGVWIISERYGNVVLYGDDVGDLKQSDKRATFSMPYRSDDVDIVTSIAGFSGSYRGEIDNRGEQDVDAARGTLEQIRRNPQARVILMWGTVAVAVQLRSLSVSPHPGMLPKTSRRHLVEFSCSQVGDYRADALDS